MLLRMKNCQLVNLTLVARDLVSLCVSSHPICLSYKDVNMGMTDRFRKNNFIYCLLDIAIISGYTLSLDGSFAGKNSPTFLTSESPLLF